MTVIHSLDYFHYEVRCGKYRLLCGGGKYRLLWVGGGGVKGGKGGHPRKKVALVPIDSFTSDIIYGGYFVFIARIFRRVRVMESTFT